MPGASNAFNFNASSNPPRRVIFNGISSFAPAAVSHTLSSAASMEIGATSTPLTASTNSCVSRAETGSLS